MIKVTLGDGSVREYEAGVSVLEVAKSISGRLAKEGLVAKVNDAYVDMQSTIDEDCSLAILKFDDEQGRDTFRHTSAHILAMAVKRLWPDAKLAIGPSIERGFYYDFDTDHNFTEKDLEKIEKEMKAIVKEDLRPERFVLPREEALKLCKEMGEDYKVELIEDLPEDEEISFYRMGDFVDLCAGNHLPTTKIVKAFKLLSATGAYWRGDEKNKMLQRIYGTSFPKANLLETHLEMLEEAKKRDHNKLGRELQLFTTNEAVGQGLPLLMPKGAKIVQILQRFVEDEEEKRGYLLTKTPMMSKNDLFVQSGHWSHYKDGMFILGDEEKDDHVLTLRPMTCPFQFMVYKANQHSYRELPLRYAETSTLFRNESSGEMHGLIRVRQFTISEGHLIVRPDQLEKEFLGVVDLINYMMETLGIEGDITYQFSKHDPKKTEKYIDNPEAWASTEAQMKTILDHIGIDYTEVEGEAAFYGPKLDIQFKNVHGKEDTIITVQIDFALPERLDMTYIDRDGVKQRPYVIHRTSIGCYERTLAMLIEKYAGKFPMWLAPEQIRILAIADRHLDYAFDLQEQMKRQGLRVEVDDRAEKIGKKIREAQLEKVPYMLIIGDKEVEESKVSVRSRDEGEKGQMETQAFVDLALEEVATRVIKSV